MKPGRIAGKGGMRQKTAENSTGKRNNVENFIDQAIKEEEAKKLLMRYATGIYEKLYGELQEA